MYVLGGSLNPPGMTCSGWRMGGGGLVAGSLVEALDRATGEWATIAPLPAGLAQLAAFTTEEGILVVGRGIDPDGEIVVARLTLPPVIGSAPLAHADQEVSSSGCGPA